MALRIGFLLIFVLAVFGEARHIHPRKDQWLETVEEGVITLTNEHDAKETEVINIVPKKPAHSILFFKSYDPCDDGFKLDYQGICREVWF